MTKTELLLSRLEAIGASVSKYDTALALIGLGSVGQDLERLDRYSDLDFFLIVRSGSKSAYLDNLNWLTDIAPAAYFYRNTVDGFKLLYDDSVFCEFAVFDEHELVEAAFSPGRTIWKAEGVAADIHVPRRQPDSRKDKTVEWLIGEALSNLYVGLCREKRGEKLSATRFVQSYAVDQALELAKRMYTADSEICDEFNLERRYEQQFPEVAPHLSQFIQGYERNIESARAIVSFLEQHFDINAKMRAEIVKLCGP